jgi:DNA invertase Pin-like site-specific DNA recombinase
MRRAIAYTRVSTPKQGESGFGHDAQRAQIDGFAGQRGFKIIKTFVETASAMGPDSIATRPELNAAIKEARRRRFKIIVAGVDRVSRDVRSFLELLDRHDGMFIVADMGEGAAREILMGEVERGQREGEMISERTKEGLANAKRRGKKLGNQTNLEEAQKKGAATNARIAATRAEEFGVVLDEVIASGAGTAREIASALNARGHRTARGQPWTKENVHRARRGLTEAPGCVVTPVLALPTPPKKFADSDGRLTSEAKSRIEAVMSAKKMKMGAVMKELGYNSLDASVGNALLDGRRIRDQGKLVALESWILKHE